MTTLCPLLTISASFSTSSDNFPGIRRGALSQAACRGSQQNLSQPREQSEKAKTLFTDRGADIIAQPIQTFRTDARVFGALHIREGAGNSISTFGGKLRRDFVFRPPQDKGGKLRA